VRVHRLTIGICGAGHSGSTLLGLVLGSHSQVFYPGEAEKTRKGCKICGPSCGLWSRFAPEPDLYEGMARLTGKPVIVDSSKPVRWIDARVAELDRLGVPHRLVFLARDGRAVVNSRVRKYGRESAEESIDQWMAQIRATEELITRRGEQNVLRLRYEELVAAPREHIERVCTFAGLAFEPAMMRYEEHEHHPLGGNTGTQSVVARKTLGHAGASGIPERSRDYYEDLDGGFRIDMRWKTELDDEVRKLFEARAGAINAPFCWDE
jgi:hypothetical protein